MRRPERPTPAASPAGCNPRPPSQRRTRRRRRLGVEPATPATASQEIRALSMYKESHIIAYEDHCMNLYIKSEACLGSAW
jgi:hypothetical protein